MDASSQVKPPSSRGTMDESSSSDSDSSSSSVSSSMSEEDVSLSTSVASSSSSASYEADGPLYQMESLRVHLPFKRGLSKFFSGKSQSFTSLADVKTSDDLAKPESPYKKKMKSSQSYGAGLNCQRSYPPQHSSKFIGKKSHNGKSGSHKKGSFLPTRPPACPVKSM